MRNQTPTVQDVAPSYLAHELRAPVTAIRLGLELLQEDLQPELKKEAQSLLTMTMKNTERLEGLIDDILDFGKLSSGKLALEKKACDALEMAREAADCVRAWARSAGVELQVEAAEPLPRIATDPKRVMQVLTNLLSNALKFTPSGGRILLILRRGVRGEVVYQVKDSGCGIPSGELESIFEAFVQSSDGQKRAHGTGLGLTLSRMLIGLMGGRIWAESRLGQGASFFFTLPLSA